MKKIILSLVVLLSVSARAADCDGGPLGKSPNDQFVCLKKKILIAVLDRLPRDLSYDDKKYLFDQYAEYAKIGARFRDDGVVVLIRQGREISIEQAAALITKAIPTVALGLPAGDLSSPLAWTAPPQSNSPAPSVGLDYFESKREMGWSRDSTGEYISDQPKPSRGRYGKW